MIIKLPPALISAPPVSYVTPLPTSNKVCSIGPSGVYVSQITLPSWRGITEAARLTAAKHGYSFSSTSCPLTTSTDTSVPLKQCSTYSATLFYEISWSLISHFLHLPLSFNVATIFIYHLYELTWELQFSRDRI